MQENWKDKTCEKCIFNIDGICYRLPPLCWGFGFQYPDVIKGFMGKKFMQACAEYKEKVDADPLP